MSYWVREVGGWLLVVVGLYLFFLCVSLLVDQRREWVLEAGPMTLIGIIVFRGGIHILKVAVAARVCTQAQAAVAAQEASTRPPRGPGRAPARAAGPSVPSI